MNELANFLSARAAAYETLAYPYYKEADNAYIDKLKSMLPVFATFTAFGNNRNILNGIGSLEKFLADTNSNTVEELATEFARLFLIKNTKLGIDGVILSESVYLSPSKLIMQDERDKVLEIYCKENLGKSKEFKETEDHLSAELGFLGAIGRKAAEDFAAGNESDADTRLQLSYTFINEHLYKWLPAAVQDIVAMNPCGYFKGIAELTLGIVETDMKFLDSF